MPENKKADPRVRLSRRASRRVSHQRW
jgi:hypothetical protein